MLILLSPAKNLDFDPAPDAPAATTPALLKHTRALSEETRKLTRSKIKQLMGVSDQLADLNYERFQALKATARARGAKQAALAFNGDVYLGLDAKSLSAADLAYAQDHLRILSGLYGLLRPLDGIEPYRLEMGSRLKTPRGASLYDFWGDLIAKELNTAAKAIGAGVIVNLASHEYFRAVDRAALDIPVVTPSFKEEKDGKLRSIQFYAKRARGLMARWAIENRVEDPKDLRAFNVDAYRFNAKQSDETAWLFSRRQPAPKAPAKPAKKSTPKARRPAKQPTKAA